jgi:hypothetical protein
MEFGRDAAGDLLPEEHVFFGRQNRMALPSGTEEYAVVSFMSAETVGKPFARYKRDTDAEKVFSHWKAEFQADFCSSFPAAALARASRFSAMCEAGLGSALLAGTGVNAIGVSGVTDASGYVDAEQFVIRSRVRLTLEYDSDYEIPVESADSLEVKSSAPEGRYFENVDVHHPSKE